MDWRKTALDLWRQGKSWADIYGAIPNMKDSAIRSYIRQTDDYKGKHQNEDRRGSIEYRSDGTIISEKFITLREGQDMTPDFVMEAHGLDSAKWEVVSYKNNFWNSQLKGGFLQISYQSKITVKPRKNGLDFEAIDRYFQNKQFKYDKPLIKCTNYNPDGEILEICLPDLHSGLLAWRQETGADYDVHIAKEYFYRVLYDIVNRCKGRKFKKVVLVTLGDLLHFDNDKQETTKGTFQQADGRLGKIFVITQDMLIDGIQILGEIASVEVIYLCGNHDGVTGYALLRGIELAFKNDDRVTVDIKPNPQKFRLWGDILVGWTHGDMQKQNMSNWLQHRARKEYGLSRFAEVHAGHFHSLKTIEAKRDFTREGDIGGIVVRYLPTISNSSYWEHKEGYCKSIQALMAFVWKEGYGLREIWQSNV